MEALVKMQVGQLVAKDYRTATVFSNFGIDFCCNGQISLEAICDKKGIEIKEVLTKLDDVLSQTKSAAIDYKSWPLDLLADYIEKTHHRYVSKNIPVLKQYLAKLCNVHGERHPELFGINKLFTEVSGELAQHMKKEEIILFPFIRKMVQNQVQNTKTEASHSETIEAPISIMEHEHDNAGEAFRKIASLSNRYTTPEDGCTTYQVTFLLLKEFEENLHLHIHLENNILFPKAIKMEKDIVEKLIIQ